MKMRFLWTCFKKCKGVILLSILISTLIIIIGHNKKHLSEFREIEFRKLSLLSQEISLPNISATLLFKFTNELSSTTLSPSQVSNPSSSSSSSNSIRKFHSASNNSPKEFQRCVSKVELFKPLDMNEDYEESVFRRHPNLPEFLVTSPKLIKTLPHFTKIRWSGTVYQESWKSSPKYLLYSANFDARLEQGLVVRILSLYDEAAVNLNFYCQFWYNETENPVMSPVYESDFPGKVPGGKSDLNPKLISCKVPPLEDMKRAPIAVSVVQKPCQTPSNVLKIGGSPYKKKISKSKEALKIGICGKAIYYYNKDFSPRLIEWIEIMRAIGISKIFLYQTTCHENVKKVLDYYEKEGIVKLVAFYYPPPYVQEGTFVRLWAKRNLGAYRGGQRMYINDCIYRNKDEFDYLAVIDPDEIPIVTRHKSLNELLHYLHEKYPLEKRLRAGYSLSWKTFYIDMPPGPHVTKISNQSYALNHNQRTKLSDTQRLDRNRKSIYDTNKVFLAACHSTVGRKAEAPLTTKMITLDRSLAYTAHFRENYCKTNCENLQTEEETFLLQYQEEVKNKMDMVLNELKITPH